MNFTFLRQSLAAAACALAAGVATAAPLQFDGTFAADDARFVFSFHLDAPTTLLANTTSFAQGGFAPILTLFGAAGGVQQAVGSAMLCGAGSGAQDPMSGACWDAVFGTSIGAGDYTLVLTQDGNYALGDTLADGFQQDGFSHYTSVFYLGNEGPLCVNADASQRSCSWALTVDGLPQAPSGQAPEPGSLALAGIALLALGRARRRG
jgi:hypothetical protein